MLSPYPASLDDEKYYCCCGCHVVLGAKIIAGILTAFCIFDVLGSLTLLANGYVPFNVLGTCISVLVICCMWYGLIEERHGFLIPFLALMGISIVMLCIMSFGAAIFVCFHGDKHSEIYNSGFLLVFLIVSTILMLSLYVWVFKIVKNAYSFLEHKQFKQNEVTNVYVAVPPTKKSTVLPNNHLLPPIYEEISTLKNGATETLV